MRVIVFFDLPVGTASERKEANRFRRSLIKQGFLMMQESVYCKLALNAGSAGIIMDAVRENKPDSGLVQMLTITEKQFSKMEFVLGEFSSEIIDTDERLIII
ncbi:MAG: CRISPR-associated endonuclease Cas2 [Ruminococcaceae bacterium]|nr:CRISPR-associated endonuclease Cas2 [Oscillospiraceae bacterium]